MQKFIDHVSFWAALVALLRPIQGSGRFVTLDHITTKGDVHRVTFKPGCTYKNSLVARRDAADQLLEAFDSHGILSLGSSSPNLIPAVKLTKEERAAHKAGKEIPGLVTLGNGHLRREVEITFEHCHAALVKLRDDAMRRLAGDLQRASSYQPTNEKGIVRRQHDTAGSEPSMGYAYLSGWHMSTKVLAVDPTPRTPSYQNPINVAMRRIERGHGFPQWRQIPIGNITAIRAEGQHLVSPWSTIDACDTVALTEL